MNSNSEKTSDISFFSVEIETLIVLFGSSSSFFWQETIKMKSMKIGYLEIIEWFY
jgi:hypothetical protein